MTLLCLVEQRRSSGTDADAGVRGSTTFTSSYAKREGESNGADLQCRCHQVNSKGEKTNTRQHGYTKIFRSPTNSGTNKLN